MPYTTRALRRNVLSVVVHSSLLSFFTASPASAAVVTSLADSGPGSLREAINAAASGDTIGFDCAALGCPATITLISQGNNQGFPGPTAFSISGKTLTIAAPNPGDITLQAQPGTSSATSLRLFFVDTGAALTLDNLSLTGGKAIGGNGGSSQAAPQAGSGGGAAGLGGAIFNQGALTLSGVSFTGNGASGGNGGGADFNSAFGGGGGMGGDGGSKAGGGGGTGGNGGSAYHLDNGTQCGGHGGAGLGGAGGGAPGCYLRSGNLVLTGAVGVNGGGGGGSLRNGGSANDGGGGGGSAGTGNSAGAGGFGGGGGGSEGIAIGEDKQYGYGGPGGFGGGGGGCTDGHGGAGGFGGGGGQTFYNPGGNFGGGGAGFGGAVFARSGSVTVKNSRFFEHLTGNLVSAGIGYRNGAAAGNGLFLISGVTTTFDTNGGVYTIDDTIADDSPTGLPPGPYTPGAGAGSLVYKQGQGFLVLNGVNTYGGLTAVFQGFLAGTGQIASNVYLDIDAAISPGDPTVRNGVGTLTTGALNWAAGGTIYMQIGNNQAGSDLLVVNGPLTKNVGSGTTWNVNFSVGDNPPKPGTTYTLIQSTDASAFAAADFSFSFDATINNLTGTFSIEGNALKFTVGTVSTNLIFRSGFD